MQQTSILHTARIKRFLSVCQMLVLAALLSFAAVAQETGNDFSAQEEPPLVPLTVEEKLALDQLLQQIDDGAADIKSLEKRLEKSEGIVRQITYGRLDRVTTDFFRNVLKIASQTIKFRKKGKDADEYRRRIEKDLLRLPDTAFEALDRVGARVDYKNDKLSTIELVAEDQRLFGSIKVIDNIYQLLFDYFDVAESMNIDVSDVRDKVRVDILEAAASRSVFLELAVDKAASLRASVTILPGNEDLAGELRAADARVKLTATALQNTIGFMQKLKLNARQYRQQLLTATGEITTDVLDVGVVANLAKGWTKTIGALLVDQGPKLLLKVFLIILIIYIAIRLSRLVEMGVNHAIDSSHVQISHLLRRMVVSTGRNLVIVLGMLIALSQVGISLGPLLAGLGIAGFIIGFAMQDALSNFASGMLILFYRPFDVGDTVEAGNVRGKVRSMSLVNTSIMTFDNQTLIIPNNMVWGNVIKNVTAQKTRRVDLVFGISYGDDIEKAEGVFRDIVNAHDKVLDSPEPMIRVNELADSSVNFIVRPWVRTADYWDVYWDVTRAVKLGLDEAGISIPFPQRDVHVHESRPAEV